MQSLTFDIHDPRHLLCPNCQCPNVHVRNVRWLPPDGKAYRDFGSGEALVVAAFCENRCSFDIVIGQNEGWTLLGTDSAAPRDTWDIIVPDSRRP